MLRTATAAFSFQDENNSPLSKRAMGFLIVLGLHVGAVAVLSQTPVTTQSSPPPIRMQMRTIEIPPPAPVITKAVDSLPKPLPQTPHKAVKPVTIPVTPSVMTAAPTTEPTVPTFSVPPQPPASPFVEAAPAAPVAVTPARFDADYLKNPAPSYPPSSRRAQEEGQVLLLVHVSSAGTAEQVEIKQSSGYPRLDEAALRAVRQWRFVPARKGDEAIAASVVVPIVFRMDS